MRYSDIGPDAAWGWLVISLTCVSSCACVGAFVSCQEHSACVGASMVVLPTTWCALQRGAGVRSAWKPWKHDAMNRFVVQR